MLTSPPPLPLHLDVLDRALRRTLRTSNHPPPYNPPLPYNTPPPYNPSPHSTPPPLYNPHAPYTPRAQYTPHLILNIEEDLGELDMLVEELLDLTSTPPRMQLRVRHQTTQERSGFLSPPPPTTNSATRSIGPSRFAFSPIRQIDFNERDNISVNLNIDGLQLCPCDTDSDQECSICFENVTSSSGGVLPVCNHAFHNDCISKWFVKSNAHTCPNCRGGVNVMDLCN